MERNRAIFELASKIVGLVLICGGAILAAHYLAGLFSTYPMPDYTALWNAIPENEPASRFFSELTAPPWRYALLHLIVKGVVPILLGLFLLRSDNLLVRLAYPARPDREATVRARVPDAASPQPQAPPAADAAEGDARYAPPGYAPDA